MKNESETKLKLTWLNFSFRAFKYEKIHKQLQDKRYIWCIMPLILAIHPGF